MRKLTLLLFLLISGVSFAQKKGVEITYNEKVVGKILASNTDIKGIEYVFPKRIHKTFVDTLSGYLTVQTRGLSRNGKFLKNKGKIFQYDLKNKKLLWHKKIAYQISNLQQFTNTMILTVSNTSNCLNVETGNEMWQVNNIIYFVDPIDNIGVGYRLNSSGGYSNKLQGIDLKNGRILWERKLNREYGWNDLFYTNDSTMIVVAGGLHAVNIRTGQGWDYNTITGKKDYTGTVAKNVAGIATGLLTGAFVTATGHDLVRDVVSNTPVDSAHIYLASREQLAKVDKQTGEVVWKHPFPKKLASKSSIFIRDSLIFMVNKGFAFMGYRQLDFGKPFVAAFDRNTGEQKYLTLIHAKKDPVLSFKLLQDEIYLVFKNRIEKYALATGKKILEKTFAEGTYGNLKYFVGEQVLVENKNKELVSLPQLDSSKVFVYTTQNKILSVDNLLNVTDDIAYEDLRIYYLRTGQYKFLTEDNHTLIVNDKGEKIAEIEASLNAFLVGNTLYDKQDQRFIAIDLTAILKDD